MYDPQSFAIILYGNALPRVTQGSVVTFTVYIYRSKITSMIWDAAWPQETFAWYLDGNEVAATSPSGTVAAPTHCHWSAGSPYWCGAAPRLPAPPSPTRCSLPVSLRPGPGACAALWWRTQALSQVTGVIKVARVCLCGISLSSWVPLVLVGSSLSLPPPRPFPMRLYLTVCFLRKPTWDTFLFTRSSFPICDSTFSWPFSHFFIISYLLLFRLSSLCLF